MLQKVVIEHFRSCEDVTIDQIGPSLVLVGPNGAGKTNILTAIFWTAKAALNPEPIEFSFDRPVAVSLDFRLGKVVYSYSMSIQELRRNTVQHSTPSTILLDETIRFSDDGGEWQELARREGPNISLPGHSPLSVGPSTPFLPFLLAYVVSDEPLAGQMRHVAEFMERVQYYPFNEPGDFSEPRGWISQREYENWLNRSRLLDRAGESVLMKLLDLKLRDEEGFSEVRDILRGLELIGDISIRPVDIPMEYKPGLNGSSTLYSIGFHPYERDREDADLTARRFAFEDLSHGTRRIIRMVVSMIFDQSSVMLIEHPEDGIHRKLTASVFNMLQAYTDPTQIIVSSHSSLVFDMLDPSEIRVVSMRDGKTEVRALTSEEAEQARRYVKEKGTLTEYLDLMIEV